MFLRLFLVFIMFLLFYGCSPYNKRKLLMYDAKSGSYVPVNDRYNNRHNRMNRYDRVNARLETPPQNRGYQDRRYPVAYPFPIPSPSFKTKSLNTNGKNYNYPIINNYYSKDTYGAGGGTRKKVKSKKISKIIKSPKACTEKYDMNKIYKSDFPVTYRIKRIKGCN